jgi:hypothetical protein
MPPWRYHDRAVDRRNNDPANRRATDATCVVDADRAVHEGLRFGNGKRQQQGDDYVFHFRAPPDIFVTLVRSSHRSEGLRSSAPVVGRDRIYLIGKEFEAARHSS